MELYVHLPFCARKCRYCDFASYAGCEERIPAYIDALLTEAAARAAELHHPVMETVFLGGGTPSLIPPEQLDKLLTGLKALFSFAEDAEFTSEANPGTLTTEWLSVAVRHGVNRLSMGMQAYQPELLQTLGRIHQFSQVDESVAMARDAGLSNISLDLMFGLPGQTEAHWHETLQAALSLQPQHLSCYGLIPEDGTPLKDDLDEGRLALPDEESERAMYDHTLNFLASHGYEQYEISNFALPGFACRHNLGYWRQVHYLGLGASASSMLPCIDGAAYYRQTNPANLQAYIAMVETAAWPQRETMVISPAEARFETMMLGLRTTQGVSEVEFEHMHGLPLAKCYGSRLQALTQKGLVHHNGDWWQLTRQGMDVQNAVLVELMDD